jgi:hypothetical protein
MNILLSAGIKATTTTPKIRCQRNDLTFELTLQKIIHSFVVEGENVKALRKFNGLQNVQKGDKVYLITPGDEIKINLFLVLGGGGWKLEGRPESWINSHNWGDMPMLSQIAALSTEIINITRIEGYPDGSLSLKKVSTILAEIARTINIWRV